MPGQNEPKALTATEIAAIKERQKPVQTMIEDVTALLGHIKALENLLDRLDANWGWAPGAWRRTLNID